MVINVYSVKMAAKFLNFISSLKTASPHFCHSCGGYQKLYVPIGLFEHGLNKLLFILLLGSFPEDSRHPFEGTNFLLQDCLN